MKKLNITSDKVSQSLINAMKNLQNQTDFKNDLK